MNNLAQTAVTSNTFKNISLSLDVSLTRLAALRVTILHEMPGSPGYHAKGLSKSSQQRHARSGSVARPRIWDPRARASSDVSGAVRATVPQLNLPQARRTAVDEYSLHKQVKRTRSELARIASAACAQSTDTGKTPLLLYERWLARASLAADGLAAPLLPNLDAEGGLAKDLVRHGASADAGARAASEAVSKSREAASRWRSRRDSKDADVDAVDIDVRESGAFMILQLGTFKPYVKVTKVHLGKLRALYCRATRRGKPLPDDVHSSEYKTFAYAVFALLMRYESLGGAGYQAALGEDAFDALHEKLGVSVECFASPLNCRYGTFCSQFKDVDAHFGSLGSFFDPRFAPTEGSFEMNPPFVPETMSLAVEKLENLLTRAEGEDKALSFVVIVPAWSDCQYWRALERSTFLQYECDIVKAEDHGFCDGSQHSRPSHERYRVSSYDTGVWYLQTSKAAKKWVVSEDVRRLVCEKMKNALGSAKNVKELEKRYRPTTDASTHPSKRTKL